MKTITLLLFGILFTLSAWAQAPGDTIVVSSFNYNSTTRDTLVAFPNLPANVTFEKILMRYNMRCKGAQVSTAANRNLGCGEWDYSCNTFITDSTKADSLVAKVNSHRISGFSGSTFNWRPFPNLYQYRQLQPNTINNTVISETPYQVGNGAINVAHPINTHNYNGRSQYLYTAAELSAAGLTAGNIDAFFVTANLNISGRLFRVKLKHTTLTQLNASTPVDTGFTEVFNHNHSIYSFTAGDRIRFHTPFVWDGTSNIMVEFSFNWPNGLSSTPTLKGHTTTLPMGIASSGDKHLYLDGTNLVSVPTYTGVSGAGDRTVEAWINTKVAGREFVYWGNNATSQKWTVRTDGSGKLRLEVNGGNMVGTTNVADSAWHHIAVTFSGTNVNQAKLYVDGQLETISSSTAIAVNTSATGNVRIGNGSNNSYFDGQIDNVRIWSAALTQTDIQNWMRKKLDNTHPSYSSLEMDLSADESTGNTIADASGNNRDGQIYAHKFWAEIEGKNLFKDFVAYNERPDIKFMRGTYANNTTIDTFWHNVEQPAHYLDSVIITSNAGTIMSDAITYSNDTTIWNADNYYTQFDEQGNFLSAQSVTPYGTINIVPLTYYQRSPMAFEIMSFVTPYGINLDLGPTGKTWTYDLTDFTPLLKGNKRMFMTMGGQWQEEMDIKFLFIVGTPPRNVHDINNIWKSNRSSNYSNINSNAVFPPRNITLPSTSSKFKIRSSVTGHGQEGEFIPRVHHVDIDGGVDEFNWTAWKECAANPVYPQGGTWIYDRAGWCPGMATDLQEFALDAFVSPGTTHSFDYDVDVASGDSRYIVNHQLVNYGAPNHTLDARITDIMNPSTRVEFARENPICRSPKIIIQNTGSTPLTSLAIHYGLNGTPRYNYSWTGNLKFMESTEVELNAPIWFWDNLNGPVGNIFEVEIDKPNGGTDEYLLNNKMTSNVVIPGVLPSEFVMIYKANNAFQETKIEIIDDMNNVVFAKTATSTAITFDTIRLNNGCYSLLFTDSDDDGTAFWANSDGSAIFVLRDFSNNTLDTLHGDFGKYKRYNFTVNYPLSYQEVRAFWDVKIYPNPTDNELVLDAKDIDLAHIEVFSVMGNKMNVDVNKDAGRLKVNTAHLASGMYFIKIQKGEQHTTKKFLIKH